MSQYFPKQYGLFFRNVTVELDLSIYPIKGNLKSLI